MDLWCWRGDGLAVTQLNGSVDHSCHCFEFMEYHDHAETFVPEFSKQLRQGCLSIQVDSGERLVHHQQLRLSGQGPCEQRPLLLPTGQWGEGPTGPVVQVYAFQCLSDNFPVGLVGTSQQPVMRQPSRGNHFLRCGALYFQRGMLRDVPYAMPFAELPDRRPEQTHLTLLERGQRYQGTKQCRLPGAIRARDSHDLVSSDAQSDIPENRQATERKH